MYKKMPTAQTVNSSKDGRRSGENVDTLSINPPHNSPKSVVIGPDHFENTNGNGSSSNNIINDNHESGDNGLKSSGFVKIYHSKWSPSLILENKASVARDHLANERTFLAWLRTSLSFIGIGIAITQLFRLSIAQNKPSDDRIGKPLGITFIILGIIFLGLGIIRYFHSQTLMTKGNFPASRGSIVLGTSLTVLSLVACMVIIFALQRN